MSFPHLSVPWANILKYKVITNNKKDTNVKISSLHRLDHPRWSGSLQTGKYEHAKIPPEKQIYPNTRTNGLKYEFPAN